MKTLPLLEIDGRRLYYMFLAGAKKIIENQTLLNKINVFPVKDGDTGTNMAATLRGVIDTIKPVRSYKVMLDDLAESVLINARGNSGIIFAQFIYGVSNETADVSKISLHEFSESVKKSVHYVYQAVSTPVEGTMLTIINAWADFIYHNRDKFSDFRKLFANSKRILDKALQETKDRLAVLREANVVDSGANAFLFFIEGMLELIHLKGLRHLTRKHTEVHDFSFNDLHIPVEVTHRYCTEALVKNMTMDDRVLRNILQKHGDSGVLAGASKMRHIHVHTDHPDQFFEEIGKFGTITFQKADDMIRQSEAVSKRKWNIALVTDSACDLSAALFDQYQINLMPINIYFGENHYLDKVTLKPDQFYQRLNEPGPYPKTAQINEQAFQNLYSHLASHYDGVIAVHLSGKFSGTYFSSKKAAEKIQAEYQKPITVLDSKNVSGGMGLIVLRIAQSIEAGFTFDQIVKNAQSWIEKAKIYVSVRNLDYMVRGGRVSHFRGALARVLNINPIVSLDKEGKSKLFDKAFSQRTNMNKVIGHIKQNLKTEKVWNYIILHAKNQNAAQWYEREMQLITGKKPIATVNISPVVSANAGLGAASVAFMYE